MFTGIVTDVGEVAAIEDRADRRFVVRTGLDLGARAIGASIACAGVCLTVVEKDAAEGWFAVDVSGETLAFTNLGDWTPGRRVNLEPSLRLGDELGGHIVSGHVDGVAVVAYAADEGGSTRVAFDAPASVAAYIAPKGSVALDGCSLTVNGVSDTPGGVRFDVNLIPHTKAVTSFGALAVGDRLNLEIDVLARYVARAARAGGALG